LNKRAEKGRNSGYKDGVCMRQSIDGGGSSAPTTGKQGSGVATLVCLWRIHHSLYASKLRTPQHTVMRVRDIVGVAAGPESGAGGAAHWRVGVMPFKGHALGLQLANIGQLECRVLVAVAPRAAGRSRARGGT